MFEGLVGAGLAVVLGRVDPDGLAEDARLDYLQASERLARWVAAVQQRALAAVAGPDPGADPDDFAREEVAALLCLSPLSAAGRIEVARTLTTTLTETLAALADGRISPMHAATLVNETCWLSEAQAREVETLVLPAAARQTPGRFTTTVRRAVLAVDPLGAALRGKQARTARRVLHYPSEDGMAVLSADLPAADAAACWAAVSAFAAAHPHPDGVDAARADALVALLTRTDPSEPASRPPVSVHLTVDLPTLLGLADQPGELAGYGPIPAGLARELSSGHTLLRRLITDPRTGALIDYARRGYRSRGLLRGLVNTLHPRCVFPGCPQPAAHTDHDHAHPHQRGGRTDTHNLHPLCRRHHRLKTRGGWQLEVHEDDSLTWTSPTGRTYHQPPPRLPTATIRR